MEQPLVVHLQHRPARREERKVEGEEERGDLARQPWHAEVHLVAGEADAHEQADRERREGEQLPTAQARTRQPWLGPAARWEVEPREGAPPVPPKHPSSAARRPPRVGAG